MNPLKNLLQKIKDFFTIQVPEYEEPWSEMPLPNDDEHIGSYLSTMGKDGKPVIVLVHTGWSTTVHQCDLEWVVKELKKYLKPRVHKRKK